MIVQKYNYKTLDRQTATSGVRHYADGGVRMPSVTTILSSTKDKSGLDKWIAKVGKEKAEQIRDEASKIGTAMHATIEDYIIGKTYQPKDKDEEHAFKMANVIIDQGFDNINEIWGSEVHLHYTDQYAGTTDLVGLYKGKPAIMDFKQTNKPKHRKWIEDYFIQLAAYAEAHKRHHGEILTGAVLMCTRDLEFQLFEINEDQMLNYVNKWWDRYDRYKAKSKSEQPRQVSEPINETSSSTL